MRYRVNKKRDVRTDVQTDGRRWIHSPPFCDAAGDKWRARGKIVTTHTLRKNEFSIFCGLQDASSSSEIMLSPLPCTANVFHHHCIYDKAPASSFSLERMWQPTKMWWPTCCLMKIVVKKFVLTLKMMTELMILLTKIHNKDQKITVMNKIFAFSLRWRSGSHETKHSLVMSLPLESSSISYLSIK